MPDEKSKKPDTSEPDPRTVPPDVNPKHSSHPSAVADASHFPGLSTTLPGTSLKDFHERIAHEKLHGEPPGEMSDESEEGEMEGMNEEYEEIVDEKILNKKAPLPPLESFRVKRAKEVLDRVSEEDLDFIEPSF